MGCKPLQPVMHRLLPPRMIHTVNTARINQVFFLVVHQVALTARWWTLIKKTSPSDIVTWSPPEVPPAVVHHLFSCTSGSHVDPAVSFTLAGATSPFVPVQKTKQPNTLTFTHTHATSLHAAWCILIIITTIKKEALGFSDTCIQLGFNRHGAAACQERSGLKIKTESVFRGAGASQTCQKPA